MARIFNKIEDVCEWYVVPGLSGVLAVMFAYLAVVNVFDGEWEPFYDLIFPPGAVLWGIGAVSGTLDRKIAERRSTSELRLRRK